MAFVGAIPLSGVGAIFLTVVGATRRNVGRCDRVAGFDLAIFHWPVSKGHMPSALLSLGVVTVLVAGVGLGAQAAPRFEAASVKLNRSGSENGERNLGGGGRLVFTNFTLVQIIAAAFEVERHQVIDAPRWTTDTRYDIVATAGQALPLTQLNAMLRTLLAERFRLAIRSDEQLTPGYALVLARGDRRLGPALKAATANCGPTGRGSGAGPAPGCSAWLGPGTITFAGQPLAQLTRALGMMLQQPVVDSTGLTGGYDVELTFSPENLPGIPAGPPGTAPADPDRPSLFAALQDQLGLKLETQRVPVKTVIVTGVALPTED